MNISPTDESKSPYGVSGEVTDRMQSTPTTATPPINLKNSISTQKPTSSISTSFIKKASTKDVQVVKGNKNKAATLKDDADSEEEEGGGR